MSDLSPMPEPQAEPGDPNPGGVDAIPDDGAELIPDLEPEDNPAVEDHVPDSIVDELGEGEDTSTEATESDGAKSGEDAEEQQRKESPA